MTSEDSSRVFLLVGKTGTGKSATGNSILGSCAFKCGDAGTSVTSEISFSRAVRQGYTLTVADAPGVMDTSVDSTEAKWKSCREMIHAMSRCPTSGKLAILLVLKYGERFTEESRATIRILKNIFGEENLWKSCVIVFTHGDLFDTNYNSKTIFADWLKEQRGDMGKIIGCCGFKCVLFHNKAECPFKEEEQLKQLMDFVDQLDQGYTKAKFDEAKKQRKRLELETLLPKLTAEYQRKISLMTEKMHSLTITSGSLEEVILLEWSASQLLSRINEMDDAGKIYYDNGEARLLQKIRSHVERVLSNTNSMKDRIQMMKRLDLLKLSVDYLIKAIDQENPKDETVSIRLPQIESDAVKLWSKVAQEKLTSTVVGGLDPSISLAKQKLARLRDDVKFAGKTRTITLKLDRLQDEVANQKIPTLVSTFRKFTERADQIVSEIKADGLQHQDEADLLEQLTDLKMKIHNLKIDNDMYIGWTSTIAIIGIISAFTAFIPIVGIPISVGLNAAPIAGKAIHRAVERSRRKEQLGKGKKYL